MKRLRYLIRISPTLIAMMLGVMLGVAACETTPPVQEMSDARMAIDVAKKAGAAQHAPYHLRAAEQYLASARELAGEKDFNQARRDAKQARMKAIDALRASEAASDSNPRH